MICSLAIFFLLHSYWGRNAHFFWNFVLIKKFGLAGVLVKSMMNGLLMKAESGQPLAYWKHQLFDFQMLKR